MKQFLVFVIIVFQFSISLAQVVNVSNATQFEDALLLATQGQIITLADGFYTRNGGFYVPVGINGTNESPIKVIGSPQVIISSNSLSTGYGLGLRGNSYWILEGFTIYNSKKGIVLDNSHHNILNRITINKIGDEGIHLRTYSSFNTVQNCSIDSVGLATPSNGEGVYIGSALENWSNYTNSNPDTCNYNIIKENVFGDHVVSENIDIKEGTTGGIILNNILNGTGLNNINGGDSWIDLKGNYYSIKCNTGHNSISDGFQTHIIVAGWGNYNTFVGNTMDVNGPGFGIKIVTSNTVGFASENKVCSNNSATNAVSGLTNIITQTCEETCDSVSTFNNKLIIPTENSFSVSPNPFNDNIKISLALSESKHFEFILIDVLGKVLLTERINTTSSFHTLYTQSISKGTYYLIISNEKGLKKVVKVVK